jgi:hypothetical protein
MPPKYNRKMKIYFELPRALQAQYKRSPRTNSFPCYDVLSSLAKCTLSGCSKLSKLGLYESGLQTPANRCPTIDPRMENS